MKEEFLRALKSRPSRFYLLGILALCFLANTAVIVFRVIYGSNEGTFAYNVMEYATWSFVIPYYTCILIADIALGNSSVTAEPGLKNKAGQPDRAGFYLSRLILSILLALTYLVITVVVLIIVTDLFHISDGFVRLGSITDFLEKMLCAVPLWLAGVGMGMMFLFLFPKKRKAYLVYLGLTVLVERGIMLLAAEPFRLAPFRAIRSLTVTQLLSLIPYPADPARNIPLTIFLGFLYLFLSTGIGIFCYLRRDLEV